MMFNNVVNANVTCACAYTFYNRLEYHFVCQHVSWEVWFWKVSNGTFHWKFMISFSESDKIDLCCHSNNNDPEVPYRGQNIISNIRLIFNKRTPNSQLLVT